MMYEEISCPAELFRVVREATVALTHLRPRMAEILHLLVEEMILRCRLLPSNNTIPGAFVCDIIIRTCTS